MLIQEILVQPPTPAVTIAIPSEAGGRHLRIRARGASDAEVDHVSVGLQINDDTAANYVWDFSTTYGGAPPMVEASSGGGDEVRARVGLVPGRKAGIPHACGELELLLPAYRDTIFLRGFTFHGGENLGLTHEVSWHGHGTYLAGRQDQEIAMLGETHTEPIGYAQSPAGMGDARLDPTTGLYYDTRAPSPPNAQRTVTTPGSSMIVPDNTPAPVASLTLLLDVGNWVVGSRVQLYVEE